MSTYLAVTIPIFAVLILVLHRLFQLCFYDTERQIPAVITNWLGLSNVDRYYSNPVAFIQKAERQHGDIFQVKMFFSTTIWMRNMQLNKQYLEASEDIWSFGDGMGKFLNQIVDARYWTHFKPFISSLSRALNQPDKLQSVKDVTIEETRLAIASWQTHCKGGDKDIELFESVSRLVHGAVVRFLMGEDFYKYHGEELFDLLHEMEDNLGDMWNFLLPHWVPHPAARRLWKARSRMEVIFKERIEARACDPGKWSDASDYITYTVRDPSTQHLKHLYAGHHTVLMFAAHTSVVSLIAWTIIELLRSPARLEKLRVSLEQHHNPKDSSYLDAILKETVRHYSSMADIRVSRKPRTVEAPSKTTVSSSPSSPSSPSTSTSFTHKLKQIIPQNHIISISPYLTHHDSTIYANPEDWNPERWLDTSPSPSPKPSSSPTSLRKILNTSTRIAYMPFGAGTHRCPGEKVARTIASNVITQIIQNCNMTIVDDRYMDRTEHINDIETTHSSKSSDTDIDTTINNCHDKTTPILNFDPSMLDFSKIGSPWLKGDIKVKVNEK